MLGHTYMTYIYNIINKLQLNINNSKYVNLRQCQYQDNQYISMRKIRSSLSVPHENPSISPFYRHILQYISYILFCMCDSKCISNFKNGKVSWVSCLYFRVSYFQASTFPSIDLIPSSFQSTTNLWYVLLQVSANPCNVSM